MSRPENEVLQAYKKYYIDRDYEQVDLFRLLKTVFNISNAIYPGSYIQVSPSFVFPCVAYIDSDKHAIRFFQSELLGKLIAERKEYPEESQVEFYGMDYQNLIDDFRSRFDLLISQFAGFISVVCKPYLKPGGYLLVNNSHGDAGMASIDRDYKLVGTVHRRSGKYWISTTSLDEYFIPNKDIKVTRELLLERKKGVGYTRTATLYLFQIVP